MISLLSGNSRVLLSVDERGCWEQLYYPYPGLHQQLKRVRLGLFDRDDDKLCWVDREGDPPTEQGYLDGSNVCRTRIERMGLELTIDNMVHPNMDVVIRRIRVHNPGHTKRRLRMFHYQSMQLGGSLYRETAYWDPQRDAINHYKRSYHFQFWGQPRFDHFTCGEHTLKGLQGSYVDAEDGELLGNPVSHGSADSVAQWTLDLEPSAEKTLHLFVIIGRSRAEVDAINDNLVGRDPNLFIHETVAYWNRWAMDKNIRPSFDLSPLARDVYRRSLFVLRNCTAATGSTIASPDSLTLREGGDGYEYCWWRDGGYISRAMSEAGIKNGASAFLRFAAQCQEPEGYFLHRHFPDGYVGPTWHPPEHIQVDQTASVLDAVHHHYAITGDLEELLQSWELVRRGADFLMGFVGDDGLPRPSFDLWEERKATNTYSTCMVVRGLRAASQVGRALGKRSDYWSEAARNVQEAALERLWNPDRKTLFKSVNPVDDTVDASTLLADIFPPGDARYEQVVDVVEHHLWQPGIGGVARYEDDHYFGHENPWIICTLWLAQARLRLGDRERCRELIEWVAKRAGPGQMLPEQLDAKTGQRRGVTPLVWSHSTFIETVNAYTRQFLQPAQMATVSAREGRRA